MSELLISFFILFSSAVYAQSAPAHVLPKEVEFAERVVINELTRALSPSAKSARERCGPPCSDNGALELGINLLGIGGEASSPGLLNMLALRLDGAGAEEAHCQLLKRGKRLIVHLKRFDASRASAWCQSAFTRARKRDLSDITDVSLEQVCQTSGEIDRERNEMLRAVQAGSRCNE